MVGPDDPLRRQLADVDQRLVLAHACLVLARGDYARCPTPAGESACCIAEAQLDELLDLRLALSTPRR